MRPYVLGLALLLTCSASADECTDYLDAFATFKYWEQEALAIFEEHGMWGEGYEEASDAYIQAALDLGPVTSALSLMITTEGVSFNARLIARLVSAIEDLDRAEDWLDTLELEPDAIDAEKRVLRNARGEVADLYHRVLHLLCTG